MSRLPDIQADLQHYVTRGGGAARVHIIGTDSASADERLDVYFQAYRLRLIEVLETDFAGLRSLVNEAEFTDLAIGYIEAHPSVHPSVRWFGELLPEFLSTQAPWRDRPVLGEMAQLEWLRGRAFDAADRTPLTSEELAAVPAEQWPGLRARFPPVGATADAAMERSDDLAVGQQRCPTTASKMPVRTDTLGHMAARAGCLLAFSGTGRGLCNGRVSHGRGFCRRL